MTSPERRVAVVTGASQGIGAAVTQAYRELGYRVVATSRTIADSGDPDVAAVRGDIAEAVTAERVVSTGLERFGRIDTVVNNAGVFLAKPFADYTPEDFASVVGVNLAGFFHLSRLAVPHMLAQGGGHIVAVTSSLVDHADSHVPSALTSLTKGGLQSAVKSLAIECASRGVRVNAVSPGIINTPMHPADQLSALSGLIPVRRLGEPQDVAGAVIYLETAPYVTGEVLHVDGGQSAGY